MTGNTPPTRREWQPWALQLLFGDEPAVTDPWPILRRALSAFAIQMSEIHHEAARLASKSDASTSDSLPDDVTPIADFTQAAFTQDEADSPMRVVLMGRTMAGKSSLLAALTGKHFERIGDGRQRFSRDLFAALPATLDDVEIVDTPGVGALDGEEDFDLAFSAAVHADLILWVASSDSIQEEAAKALRLLGLLGKPVLVVLNCRQALSTVGKLNLLNRPERVFGQREGLVSEIRRHLSATAVEPIEVVFVHALAAAQSLAHADPDHALHAASRIDQVFEALAQERNRHSGSRRVIRLVDERRRPAEGLAASLAAAGGNLATRAEYNRSLNADIHARLARLIKTTNEAVASDIERLVGLRRDWHLGVSEFGTSLRSDWDAEIKVLQGELDDAVNFRLSTLAANAEEAVGQTQAEWASIPSDDFQLEDLTGFESVWKNRAARAGLAGGVVLSAWGGAVAGAQIGALLGIEGGPLLMVVTGTVGAAVGAVAPIALKPLKDLVDRAFLGKDAVFNKRRSQLGARMGPILDSVAAAYGGAIGTRLAEQTEGLEDERATIDDNAADLDHAATRFAEKGNTVLELLSELDKETTVALLRVAGRERLATSVRRATRVPGVCILCEFSESASWESWLYPPDIGERLAGGRRPSPGAAAASAYAYMLSLTDAPVRLARADVTSATLRIDTSLPVELLAAWSDALTLHTGRQVLVKKPSSSWEQS